MNEEKWEKELRELAEAWNKRFDELKVEIGENISSLQRPSTSSEKGEGENVPTYKCKGKDCGVIFDDADAFVRHVVKEELASKIPPPKVEEPPKKKHETVKEYLECPECRPRFDQAYREFGWTPPKPKEEKESDII